MFRDLRFWARASIELTLIIPQAPLQAPPQDKTVGLKKDLAQAALDGLTGSSLLLGTYLVVSLVPKVGFQVVEAPLERWVIAGAASFVFFSDLVTGELPLRTSTTVTMKVNTGHMGLSMFSTHRRVIRHSLTRWRWRSLRDWYTGWRRCWDMKRSIG